MARDATCVMDQRGHATTGILFDPLQVRVCASRKMPKLLLLFLSCMCPSIVKAFVERETSSLSRTRSTLTSNHIVFVEKSLPTTTTLRRIFYYLETSPRTGAYSISLGLKRCVQTHSLISLFSLSLCIFVSILSVVVSLCRLLNIPFGYKYASFQATSGARITFESAKRFFRNANRSARRERG